MSTLRKFLVVDDNADSRFLLVKTLLRKFPQAVVQETQDANTAVANAKAERLDAIIVHRAGEVDGLTLVRLVRHVNSTTPIVMVSGIDRTKEALAAGATTFLNYDAWLRIGSVVAQFLSVPQSAQPFAEDDRDPRVPAAPGGR